jgi:hypothetical protein
VEYVVIEQNLSTLQGLGRRHFQTPKQIGKGAETTTWRRIAHVVIDEYNWFLKFAKNKEKCAIWLYEDYQQSAIGNFHKYVMIGVYYYTRQTIIWSFGCSPDLYIVIWNENIYRDWSRDDQYRSFFLLFFFLFLFLFFFFFYFFRSFISS